MSFDDDVFSDHLVASQVVHDDDDPAAMIGAAVGIVMVHLDLPYPEAFSLLRHTSERRGCDLEDLANDIVLSGTSVADGIASILGNLPIAIRANQAAGAAVPQGDAELGIAPVVRLSRELDDSVPARLLDLLVVTTDLGELLGAVAEMATETVPGCSSASITVVHRGSPATIGASDERAMAIDQAQYREGAGPCIEAAYTESVAAVDEIGASQYAWQQVAQEKGVTATFSVPIPSSANIAASLNLYTTRATKWPRRTLIAADALASYAGDAITLAYRMTRHDPKGPNSWAQLG
jgi:hypothetical protein